jgi:hypothetical protein
MQTSLRRGVINRARFSISELASTKEGRFFKARVGFSKVSKTVKPNIPAPEREKVLADTIKGYTILRQSNLPVTRLINYNGKRLTFEKARTIHPGEVEKRADEMLSLIQKAGERGLYVDTVIDNFGIDKKGRVVFRDPNSIHKVNQQFISSLTEMETKLDKNNPKDREALRRIDILKKTPQTTRAITHFMTLDLVSKLNNQTRQNIIKKMQQRGY